MLSDFYLLKICIKSRKLRKSDESSNVCRIFDFPQTMPIFHLICRRQYFWVGASARLSNKFNRVLFIFKFSKTTKDDADFYFSPLQCMVRRNKQKPKEFEMSIRLSINK